MAQNKGSQPRDENLRQGVGGKTDKTGTANASRARTDEPTSDRERSIESRREEGERTRGLSRRPATAPVYGTGGTPFSLMRRMMDDMDRLFENFGGAGVGRTGLGLTPFFGGAFDTDPWSGLARASWAPQVETFRRGDSFVVRADLPGLNREDVNVEVENDTLTITGERRDEHEEDRDGYYRSERSYGQFYRAIPLPEGVNGEQCEATFKDGVLEVTLPAPKSAEQRRKKIQIR